MAPILIFIGLEIMAQAFDATPKHHHKAVALAFIPLIAYLVLIQVNSFLQGGASKLTGELAHTYGALVTLSNGFILTSLLWASALACIIDKKLNKAAIFMGVAAFFSLFGIIHSPYDNGKLFLPFEVNFTTHFQFFGAYLLAAAFLVGMALSQPKKAS
ncbi:MAG: hypothetical protein LAN62_07795 [Acidobacteriia bacterium]|nr:hypothetical protein [Terriglobia bacterium]